MLPKAFDLLIAALGDLPGVGPRTAERYAYSLFRRDRHIAERLAGTLAGLHDGVGLCPVTFALIDRDQTVSPLYDGAERDKQTVAVVEEPLDIIALEKTGQYKGTYHVLGGVISPIDGFGPEQLHIPELLDRLRRDAVQEVILATNASVEGESTALYIQRAVGDAGLPVRITRLARGIPAGVDLEYADQVTLIHALQGRKQLSD